MANKLTRIAVEILKIEEDLQIRLRRFRKHIEIDDFDLHIFEQVWGSTALGFTGIGFQALTKARTYVFVPSGDSDECFVYFNEEFAYMTKFSSEFMNDVFLRKMLPVSQCKKYDSYAI